MATIEITLDGDKSAHYEPASLQVDKRLNSPSSASFRLVFGAPLEEADFPRVGMPVTISDTDAATPLLFAGYLSTLKVRRRTLPSFASLLEYECECEGWAGLLRRYLVADRFAEGMTVGAIVRAIIETSTRLSEEGITTAGVEEGPEIGEVRFNYETAAECLDKLAELIGWSWYVDDAKDLRFWDRSSDVSPIEYRPGGASWLSLERSWDLDGYRNRQLLKAGKGRTELLEEVYPAKVDDPSYEAIYEVAEQPEIATKATGADWVTISPGAIGVQGVDEEDEQTSPPAYDWHWFWKPGTHTIRRNRNLSALASTDLVRFRYLGLYPLLVQADNPAEQAARATDQGAGPGIYEDIEDDDTIDGVELAQQRAEGLLDAHDDVAQKVALESDNHEIPVGALVYVEHAGLLLDGLYLVERVTLIDRGALQGTAPLVARLDLVVAGQVVRDWAFWREVIASGKKLTYREDEKILVLRKTEEVLVVDDGMGVLEEDFLSSWELDGYSVMLIELSMIGDPIGDVEEYAD